MILSQRCYEFRLKKKTKLYLNVKYKIKFRRMGKGYRFFFFFLYIPPKRRLTVLSSPLRLTFDVKTSRIKALNINHCGKTVIFLRFG